MNRFFQILIILLSFQLSVAAETKPVNEWDDLPLRENLYDRRQTEIAKKLNFDQLNHNILTSIQEYQPQVSEGRASGITQQLGQQLLTEMIMQEQLMNTQKKYDPECKLGFCFGRALKLHLELLRFGINKDSIKKIFAIGPMNTGNAVWQFHVATIVKDLNTNQWWVLDTNLKRPVSVNDWMNKYQEFRTDKIYQFPLSFKIDPEKSIRFYITKPEKLGASGWEYNTKPGGLFDGFYNSYFKDMFQSFKQNPIPPERKLNSKLCSKLF